MPQRWHLREGNEGVGCSQCPRSQSIQTASHPSTANALASSAATAPDSQGFAHALPRVMIMLLSVPG
jgi:hypothetical protein